MMDDIEKWKRRTIKKGPFRLENKSKNFNGFKYYLIWNEKDKTKYGYLYDGMYCRYGIKTISVLNGGSMLDLWNGSAIDASIFNEMLKVRNNISSLPDFDINTVIIKGW